MIINQEIQQLVKYLKQSRHVVAFTGAGISTPSGIPDFRSPTSGLWDNVDAMLVASLHGFRQNPRGFYDWVRPLASLTISAKPNPAHLALYALEEMGLLYSIITQNIDMLHTKAGNSKIYELHGHLRQATCILCYKKFPGEQVIARFLEDDAIPTCDICRGVLKPDVILFGEQLPYQQLQGAKDAARACDMMLIIGSSLEVAPANELPMLAKRTGAKIAIINLAQTPFDEMADVVIHEDVASILPLVVHELRAEDFGTHTGNVWKNQT